VCSVQPLGAKPPRPHHRSAGFSDSQANQTSQQCRRSSQKPPAELYETFKSKFPGIVHNATVSSSPDVSHVVPGATALDVAPSVLPMYVLLHAYALLGTRLQCCEGNC